MGALPCGLPKALSSGLCLDRGSLHGTSSALAWESQADTVTEPQSYGLEEPSGVTCSTPCPGLTALTHLRANT